MCSCGEDESINKIFLHILNLLFFVEEISGVLGLPYADDVGLAEQAGAGVEAGDAMVDD